MTSTRPYQLIDLFSGAGGFSLGFTQPESLNGLGQLGYADIEITGRGFETLLGVEQNAAASETLTENFDCHSLGDIKNQTFESWTDADVVIGGPPCQGFSLMNGKKTQNLDGDSRNHLWRHFMRAVETIDPDVFVIENVPRFLQTTDGWGAYQKATEELGYTVIVDDLWAHEYGVPQERHRAFMIGSKCGTPFFPEPTTRADDAQRTVRQAFAGLSHTPTNENWHRGRRQSEKTKKRMELIPPGGDRRDLNDHPELLPECWKGDYTGHTDCYGRLEWGSPSVTIRKDYISPMKGRFLHPEANRAITPREGARLQTFPDEFSFATNAKTKMTDQVGNAVPPKLAFELANAVSLHLEKGYEGVLEPYTVGEDLTYTTATGFTDQTTKTSSTETIETRNIAETTTQATLLHDY